MKKMKSVIDDLHSCSDYLNGLAAELEQMFKAAPDEGEAAPNELPTKEPGKNEAPEKLPLKFEDVRAVLAIFPAKDITQRCAPSLKNMVWTGSPL